MPTNLRKLGFGLAFMVFGSVVIIGALLVINRLAQGPDARELDKQTSFQIERESQPPPPRVQRQEPPPPRRSRNPNPPLANLDTSLGGIDLGIPGISGYDLGSLRDDLLGDTRDVIMTDDSVDMPPRPRHREPIPYPSSARKQGVEGYVVLSLLISETGEIEQVEVLESSPAGLFDQNAVEGVRSWRFEPAQYQGRNVRVWARQSIRFDLS